MFFKILLDDGSVIMGWRRANVVLTQNHRPVSVTSLVYRMLGKVFRKQIKGFLTGRKY